MSVAGDSPVHSSSSDDFTALLDAELDAISSEASSEREEEEEEENEEEEEVEVEEEDVDLETERIKRQRVDRLDNTEEGSTSLAPIPQNSDASVKLEICTHPGFIRDMCILCGHINPAESKNDGSAVAFGYIHKDLVIGSEELARLRAEDLKSLLRNKKLILILDLDHTLLNSTRLIDISPDEKYLISQAHSMQDIPNGSLFKLDNIHMFTKLRPFVRTFLKEASSMFEMYVYTMGERPYALEMAQLLDPGRVYFDNRVISQADCTQKHQKGLDVVLGADSAVIILDDTEFVWQKHKENLILMDRYHFFSSSGRTFGLNNMSLSESKMDENESDGILVTVLEVLKRIHQIFFDSEGVEDIMGRDVRQVLKTVRREVLKGCKLVFTHVWKLGERPENQRLWEVAEQLGATCCKELDPSVTHVVSMDAGTEKSRWAVKHKKFLVNPRWIEAANFLWKRQPEEDFPVQDSNNNNN